MEKLFKALEERMAKARYTKRTGTPGHYKYEYGSEGKQRIKKQKVKNNKNKQEKPEESKAPKLGNVNFYRYDRKDYVSFKINGEEYGGELVSGSGTSNGKTGTYLSHIEWDDNKEPENSYEVEEAIEALMKKEKEK